MFKNYLKIAFRNFRKQGGYSFINVVGLAIGMTVCLLILMYIVNEMSYESFHKKKDSIYRVSVKWGSEQNKVRFVSSMPALAPALNEKIPEVEKAIRIQPDYNAVLINQADEKIKVQNLFFSDPDIFDIFSFSLKTGNKETALVEPFSVVLSEAQALKFFGNENPLDKFLLYGENPIKVTGVIEDIPANTHLKCEFLISYSTLRALGREFEKPWNNWGDDLTYILIKENVDINFLIKKLDDLLLENTSEWFASRMDFHVQPLSDIHWDTEVRWDIGPKGNIMYVYVFLSAAIFVLIIACFNFMNLSTSRYLDRMREVGIRKVIGANRRQLIIQFLLESFMITIFAILIGVALFELLHFLLYEYLDSRMVYSAFHFKYLYVIIITMIICVGLFAGGYPALFLSKFKSVEIMKRSTSGSYEKFSFRKIFVVIQFAISMILIAGTLVIYQQLDFMKNSDLGFEKENVVLINFPFGDEVAKEKYFVLRDEWLLNPNIISVSSAYTVPGFDSRMNVSVRRVGSSSNKSITLQALPADYGFVSAVGLSIIEGRDFSQDFSTDKQEGIILNQTAVQILDLEDPIGEKLQIHGNRDVSVIGVVKDFHLQSLHNKINPMFIYMNTDMINISAIKLEPQNAEKTIAYIEGKWKDILPGSDFNYRYLKDVYDNLYRAEEKTGILLSIFTALALLVSCLGVLGLTSFLVNKRIKEIGIRKVLGATVTNIVLIMSREFVKWILIANLIAWPIAYFIMNKWLRNFAYQIGMNALPFIFSSVIAIVIALVSVGSQTIKAATANPVETLRYE